MEICEDLWVPAPPSVRHALAGATVIANVSASDEIIGKADYRRLLTRSLSGPLICGYLYADAGTGESTTDLVFAGHNLICENGRLLKESVLFTGGIQLADLDLDLLELSVGGPIRSGLSPVRMPNTGSSRSICRYAVMNGC